VSKTKLLILLSLINLVLFCLYFFLKIYFQPVAVVVPHHDFVKEQRLNFLNQIAKKRLITQKIILISPDHFSPSQLNISYANIDWESDNSSVKFAHNLENKLSSVATLRNNIVKKDHGIFNLIPDIQKVWPQAEVFPIIIGQDYPITSLDNLVNQIKSICKFNCLLISSVDFSHYLPSGLAEIHDLKSIKELNNQNLIEISKLEVDSPQSLYVLSKFSQQKNATRWNLFYHSNSGELSNNYDAETTSHVIGFYQRSFLKNPNSKIATYLIGQDVDKDKSLNSLGDRFFYGTDYVDLNYSEKSKFILPFEFPKNTIITVVESQSQIQYQIFPIETINSQTFFLRGKSKQNQLHLINDQIKLKPNCIFQDIQTIICQTL